MISAARPKPFLKWPGGKRALLASIVPELPTEFGAYFEPFAGSAALFFRLAPTVATLTDTNDDLINAYVAIRDYVEAVIAKLRRLKIGEEEYYRIRKAAPTTCVGRAVRFLYLNRTAFNGIYRVNRKGEFNVPFGCKSGTILCDTDNLRRVARILQNTDVKCADFETSFLAARRGDLIYADPPYTTLHDNNGFRRYNESIFSWDDQVRLATAARNASARGVFVAVSNANHSDIVSLYQGFSRVVVERASCISAQRHGRTRVTELMLLSRERGGSNA